MTRDVSPPEDLVRQLDEQARRARVSPDALLLIQERMGGGGRSRRRSARPVLACVAATVIVVLGTLLVLRPTGGEDVELGRGRPGLTTQGSEEEEEEVQAPGAGTWMTTIEVDVLSDSASLPLVGRDSVDLWAWSPQPDSWSDRREGWGEWRLLYPALELVAIVPLGDVGDGVPARAVVTLRLSDEDAEWVRAASAFAVLAATPSQGVYACPPGRSEPCPTEPRFSP